MDLIALMKKAAKDIDFAKATQVKGDRSESWLRFGKYDLEFVRFDYILNDDIHANIREGLRVVCKVLNHEPFTGYNAPEELRKVIEEAEHTPGTEVVRTFNIFKASSQKFAMEPMLKEIGGLFGALWTAGPLVVEGPASDWFDGQIEEHGLDPDGEFTQEVFNWFLTYVKQDQEMVSALFTGTPIALDLVPGRDKEKNIKTFSIKATGATAVDKRHYWLVRG